MHLCAEFTAEPWMLEPFGKVGALFSLQLLLLTQFDKIENKNIITKYQYEKHKTSSLGKGLMMSRIMSIFSIICLHLFSHDPLVECGLGLGQGSKLPLPTSNVELS